METQSWLSRHKKIILAGNITILSVSSDDYLHASLSSQSSKCGVISLFSSISSFGNWNVNFSWIEAKTHDESCSS